VVALTCLWPGCSEDPTNPTRPVGPDQPADSIPPANITDLEATAYTRTSLTLTWTAPGDDGESGRAAVYEIRYTTDFDMDWDEWAVLTDPPVPADSGVTDTAVVTNLMTKTNYLIDIRSADKASNWSESSNLVVGVSWNPNKRIWRINSAKTGDAPTIQAGVDSAGAGDLILVAPGRYTWSGQGTGTDYGMIFYNRGVTGFELRSETGPETTILDAQRKGRLMYIMGYNDVVIDGFTFTKGEAAELGYYCGGALETHLTSPTIRNCVFTDNHAQNCGGAAHLGGWGEQVLENCHFYNNSAGDIGGALSLWSSDPTSIIRDCIIENNQAGLQGGGIYNQRFTVEITGSVIRNNTAGETGGGLFLETGGLKDGNWTTDLTSCTVVGNGAPSGGGIAIRHEYEVAVKNSIIAFNRSGGAIYLYDILDNNPILSLGCCDLYGNVGGDVIPAEVVDLGGNIQLDPLFCADDGSLAHWLSPASPCVVGNHPADPACSGIGCFPVGCE
jgi:hypothetical protein